VRQGYSVLFTSAVALITGLVQGQAEGKLEDKLTRYAKPKLLIVDEFGYLPFETQAAHLFYALVSRRYERGSMLVTSNRSVSEWGIVLNEPNTPSCPCFEPGGLRGGSCRVPGWWMWVVLEGIWCDG